MCHEFWKGRLCGFAPWLGTAVWPDLLEPDHRSEARVRPDARRRRARCWRRQALHSRATCVNTQRAEASEVCDLLEYLESRSAQKRMDTRPGRLRCCRCCEGMNHNQTQNSSQRYCVCQPQKHGKRLKQMQTNTACLEQHPKCHSLKSVRGAASRAKQGVNERMRALAALPTLPRF